MSKSSFKLSECAELIGLLVILYWWYIFISSVWTITRSATLNCQKIKQEYVSCQLNRRYLLGFWTDAIPEFQLLGSDIETTENEGGEFETLYLKTDKGRIKFYQYGLNEATDAPEIDVLLNDSSKSSLEISRAWNLFYDPLCIILSPLLFFGFLNIVQSVETNNNMSKKS